MVGGLNWNVDGERVHVAHLVDAEQICNWLIITAALLDSEATVSKAICDEPDVFPVQESSAVPDL